MSKKDNAYNQSSQCLAYSKSPSMLPPFIVIVIEWPQLN